MITECEVFSVTDVIQGVMFRDVADGKSRFVQYEFAQLELAHGSSRSQASADRLSFLHDVLSMLQPCGEPPRRSLHCCATSLHGRLKED